MLLVNQHNTNELFNKTKNNTAKENITFNCQ